jgi:hypothetical protein
MLDYALLVYHLLFDSVYGPHFPGVTAIATGAILCCRCHRPGVAMDLRDHCREATNRVLELVVEVLETGYCPARGFDWES